MPILDQLNAQDVIDTIRRGVEAELSVPGVVTVVRQDWLELEKGMIFIHTVHTKRDTTMTIGIPLPETPMDVTDSFTEAQAILEGFYGLARPE